MRKALLLSIIVALMSMAVVAVAVDQAALLDGNGHPTLIAEDNVTANEINRIKADTSGNLMVSIASGTVTTVTNVASGTFTITDGTDNALVDSSGNLMVNATGALTVSGSVTVTATDLDIRNLTAASDAVTIQGGNTVDVSIDDGGNSITVDGSSFDIRQLTAASDSVTIQGGNTTDVSIDDGGNSLTVDASSLDIRPLTSASDTVTVTGSVAVTATDLDVRNLTAASDTVTVTGTVVVGRLTTYEYDNSNVGAATQTVVAAAATSYTVSVFNGGAGALFVVMCDDAACSGETPAAANTGLEIPSGSGKTWENVTAAGVSVFNEDTSAADVSIEWRR